MCFPTAGQGDAGSGDEIEGRSFPDQEILGTRMAKWSVVYSHDVKETAAILVYQAILPGIKIYFYSKIVFCIGTPIWPLVR